MFKGGEGSPPSQCSVASDLANLLPPSGCLVGSVVGFGVSGNNLYFALKVTPDCILISNCKTIVTDVGSRPSKRRLWDSLPFSQELPSENTGILITIYDSSKMTVMTQQGK